MALIALVLVASGCGGQSSASGDTGGDGSGGKLTLVAYSTPEEAYKDLIPAFNKTSEGKGVTFSQSYAASGEQSRAVEGGLPADVVEFSLEPDMTRLVDADLVDKGWNQNQYKTTVFVTHDQEEAMEVAEQIVVLNEGRIEQVGSPQELYEKPSNEFVMGFVGPVSELSGRWIRPHDVDILREPAGDVAEAMIDRILHLGFEVRVELTLGDGEKTWVQTTKAQAEELELSEGEIVWLRPNAPTVDAPSDEPIPA